jgi:Family of unknown function (DUF6934)
MDLDKYPVFSDNDRSSYEFLSQGPNGTIKKVVAYQEIGHNIFNLAFGDWNEIKQVIDDEARSNNNDRDKVLVTVATTVIDFVKFHPKATIFVKGSTPARTRLYQMGIVSILTEINRIGSIEGFYNGIWEPIQRKSNYEAFILRVT